MKYCDQKRTKEELSRALNRIAILEESIKNSEEKKTIKDSSYQIEAMMRSIKDQQNKLQIQLNDISKRCPHNEIDSKKIVENIKTLWKTINEIRRTRIMENFLEKPKLDGSGV